MCALRGSARVMATHDEGKRETRARMKDRQCVSAIVCRQGRGLTQTHGAEWHCPGIRVGLEREIQTVMSLRETSRQKRREKKAPFFKSSLALTPTLTYK